MERGQRVLWMLGLCWECMAWTCKEEWAGRWNIMLTSRAWIRDTTCWRDCEGWRKVYTKRDKAFLNDIGMCSFWSFRQTSFLWILESRQFFKQHSSYFPNQEKTFLFSSVWILPTNFQQFRSQSDSKVIAKITGKKPIGTRNKTYSSNENGIGMRIQVAKWSTEDCNRFSVLHSSIHTVSVSSCWRFELNHEKFRRVILKT